LYFYLIEKESMFICKKIPQVDNELDAGSCGVTPDSYSPYSKIMTHFRYFNTAQVPRLEIKFEIGALNY